MDIKSDHKDTVLRELSPQDLLSLGAGHIAYIKPVMIMNRQAYALHAADGTALTLTDSCESALALARQNDLDPVIVH